MHHRAGTQFLELLINLERMSDHCSNVALHILRQTSSPDDKVRIDSHAYMHELHHGGFNQEFDDSSGVPDKILPAHCQGPGARLIKKYPLPHAAGGYFLLFISMAKLAMRRLPRHGHAITGRPACANTSCT